MLDRSLKQGYVHFQNALQRESLPFTPLCPSSSRPPSTLLLAFYRRELISYRMLIV